ncbi:hypothetical protein, partial [Thiohalocapsa sp. ML1]|uniref:beta strand repeat-containing protein n=1 Tax=Thiohalocapsa sp. ML1 TaxID=1431688 RepID=UPI00138F49D2
PGAELTISGPVTADGMGADIALSTTGSGDIALEGTVTADDDEIAVTSAGGIGGSGGIAAASAALEAVTDIGSAADPLDTDVDTLDAATTGAGSIYIAEADALTLGGSAAITTGADDRHIEVGVGGVLTVAQNVTATGDGAVTLVSTDTGGGSGIVVQSGVTVGTAAGTLALDAGGAAVTLHDANAPSHSLLRSTEGDIEIAAGALVIETNDPTAAIQIEAPAGALTLLPGAGTTVALGDGAADGDFALDDDDIAALSLASLAIGADAGRVGAIDIDTADFGETGLTLFGAAGVTDVGAGTHLTAGALTIDTTGVVGDAADLVDTALGTAVRTIDIVASAIDIDNVHADLVTVARLHAGGGGAIDFDQSGGNVTFNDVETAGTATLGASANLVVAETGISAGTANLAAGGSITGGVIGAGTADLDAGNLINVTTAAQTLDAESATGGITIANALAADVTVTALRALGTGGIDFDQAGGGSLEIQAASTADGGIDIA